MGEGGDCESSQDRVSPRIHAGQAGDKWRNSNYDTEVFTGIVERTARVGKIEDRPGARAIQLAVEPCARAPRWRPVTLGESIAVSGVCLTVVEARGPDGLVVSFEAVPETLSKTTLGRLREGKLVNLERSLAVGDLLGGHFVTGHVDAVGRVRAKRPEGEQVLFEIEAPPQLIDQVLPKGSIAVDGVSLTVIDVDRATSWFSFAAIPHTMAQTTLSQTAEGGLVNLEADAIGKWVIHAVRQLASPLAAGRPGRPGSAGGADLLALLERAGFGTEKRSEGR